MAGLGCIWFCVRCRRGPWGIDKVLHEKTNSEFQHRSDTELGAEFGTLGYPGFSHLRDTPRNPAELHLDALDRPDLDARLLEAPPRLPLNSPNMNWDCLISQAKRRNRQNRLGFVIAGRRKFQRRISDWQMRMPYRADSEKCRQNKSTTEGLTCAHF
jgi:hypothetical protein